MRSTILLLSPQANVSSERDMISRITAYAQDQEAVFILDAGKTSGNGFLLNGNQRRNEGEGQVRNYISLYIGQAHANLAGLYENPDISIQIGHPGQIADTYSIEELSLNDDMVPSGPLQVFYAGADSLRFTIEKNNQMMISGSFWCTLKKEGKELPASGTFKCWKV